MATEEYSIWVLYKYPNDYPDKYVGRRWMVKPQYGPTDDIRLADDLESLRTQLPQGLHRLDRQKLDDPKIVECWV